MIDKQVLEVTLKSILEIFHESLEKGEFRYYLTPTIDNVLLDLEFDKAHKEGEAIIVPCGTFSGRSTRLYEAIISPDKSIKLIHRSIEKAAPVTSKVMAKIAPLKALARPLEVEKDPYYFNLTGQQWEKLRTVNPQDYIELLDRLTAGTNRRHVVKKIIAFELEMGREISRCRSMGKKIARRCREESQRTTVAIPCFVNSHVETGFRNNVDGFISLPSKFRCRIGLKVLKHGLPVAIRLSAEEGKPEVCIDILRDDETALVTGFRIAEGDGEPELCHIEALYRRSNGAMELIITNMYTKDFISIIEEQSNKGKVFLRIQFNSSGRTGIMNKKYEIGVMTMSHMDLGKRIGFVAIGKGVPSDIEIPNQTVLRPGRDKNSPCVRVELSSIEIRGLKIPPPGTESQKKKVIQIVAFEKLFINGMPSDDVTEIYKREADGKTGPLLFAVHREYDQGRNLSRLVQYLAPGLKDFVIKGQKITHFTSRSCCIQWAGEDIPIPADLHGVVEMHIIDNQLSYFVPQNDDKGPAPIKISVTRDDKRRVNGIVIDSDRPREEIDYVIVEGTTPTEKAVYRLYRPAQARWPFNWARVNKLTGTIRGPVNIYDTGDKRGGQFFVFGSKNKPARLFRSPLLLERTIEFRFEDGELINFYFPSTGDSVPAEDFEIKMIGKISISEWNEYRKRWAGWIFKATKLVYARHKGLFDAAGWDFDDINNRILMIFMNHIERLPKGEDVDTKLISSTIKQTLVNCAWDQIRNDKGLTDVQVRRLRKMFALKLKVTDEGRKLKDEEIKEAMGLTGDEFSDLLKLSKFIFEMTWHWREPGGYRPDGEDEAPRFTDSDDSKRNRHEALGGDRYYKQKPPPEAGSSEDRLDRQLRLRGGSLYSGTRMFHHGDQFSAPNRHREKNRRPKRTVGDLFPEISRGRSLQHVKDSFKPSASFTMGIDDQLILSGLGGAKNKVLIDISDILHDIVRFRVFFPPKIQVITAEGDKKERGRQFPISIIDAPYFKIQDTNTEQAALIRIADISHTERKFTLAPQCPADCKILRLEEMIEYWSDDTQVNWEDWKYANNLLDAIRQKGADKEVVFIRKKDGKFPLPIPPSDSKSDKLGGQHFFAAQAGPRDEPVQFLRDIVNPQELTQNMIEGILSALFSNKKLTLAFSKKLKGLESVQLRALVQQLRKWKESTAQKNSRMKALLDNFTILEYDNLKAALEESRIDVNAKDGLIFTYAPKPKDESKDAANIGSAVRRVYIVEQEGGFPSNYYYPLLEMVTVSLAKELLQWDESRLKEALAASKINKDTFGIETAVDKRSGVLIFKVLPRIERYDNNSRIDRYTRLVQFLRSA